MIKAQQNYIRQPFYDASEAAVYTQWCLIKVPVQKIAYNKTQEIEQKKNWEQAPDLAYIDWSFEYLFSYINVTQ